MRKLIGILVVVALVATAVGFSGCAKKAEEIKIGAILPLTGGAGKYGEDAKLGIDLAVDEINVQGRINGKKVKVIYEDNQSNPQQSVAAIRKLITVDKVPAIIGPMTSSAALAVAPIAEQSRVVLFSPAASAPAISKAGDYIFRNELSDAYGGVAQAGLTWIKLKIKGVAILHINNDYGVGVRDAFSKIFTNIGGQIVDIQSFEPDATDFRTQLTRIRQKSPESIFIISYKESIPILRQIKELGIKAQLLSTPVFEDKEVLEKAGDAAEGVIYVYYGGFDPQSRDELTRNFVESFKRKYNREPGYYSALAYDAMKILALAIEKGGYKSEGIKKSLYDIKDFSGITGETAFDANGDVTKPAILKIVRKGKFERYEVE